MGVKYGGYSYIDYNYNPDKKWDLVSLWYVESEKFDIETAASALAAESSVGTWTDLKTLRKEVFEKLKGRVYKVVKINEHKGFVYIAYPLDLFERDNIIEILSSVAGNVFGLKELDYAKLLDIYWPKAIQKHLPGPQFGLEGIRKIVGTHKDRRPHIGTIVKPKIGLNSDEWAKVACDSARGGVDFIKDDENLTSPDFNKFEDRVYKTLKCIEKIEEETGRVILYSANITAPTVDEMVERAKLVKDLGGKIVMLDVVLIGLVGLFEMRKELEKLKLPIHAHRAMHAALDRGNFGFDFKVWAKIFRMIGVDQLHAGTIVGKMEGSFEVVSYYNVLREMHVKEDKFLFTLEQEFENRIKPVFPVASGGLHPGMAKAIVEIVGKDVVINFGGGIHGHPKGTYHGAKAVRSVIENVVMQNVSYEELARKDEDVRLALKKWGYIKKDYVKTFFNIMREYRMRSDFLWKEYGIKYLEFLDRFIRREQLRYTTYPK